VSVFSLHPCSTCADVVQYIVLSFSQSHTQTRPRARSLELAPISPLIATGTTPLHRASDGGHVGLARLFMEHGSDAAGSQLRARTKDGNTLAATLLHRVASEVVMWIWRRGGSSSSSTASTRQPRKSTGRLRSLVGRPQTPHKVMWI